MSGRASRRREAGRPGTAAPRSRSSHRPEAQGRSRHRARARSRPVRRSRRATRRGDSARRPPNLVPQPRRSQRCRRRGPFRPVPPAPRRSNLRLRPANLRPDALWRSRRRTSGRGRQEHSRRPSARRALSSRRAKPRRPSVVARVTSIDLGAQPDNQRWCGVSQPVPLDGRAESGRGATTLAHDRSKSRLGAPSVTPLERTPLVTEIGATLRAPGVAKLARASTSADSTHGTDAPRCLSRCEPPSRCNRGQALLGVAL